MTIITPKFLLSFGLSPTIVARFFAKINFVEGGCWLWTGALNNGYGQLHASSHRTYIRAHVLSWLLHFGPIPPETPCVLHDCPTGDNPACVNPAHLWLGTKADNLADMASKGRSGPRPHGEQCHTHKLTAVQVLEIRRTYAEKSGHRGTFARLVREARISDRAMCDIIAGKSWRHLL